MRRVDPIKHAEKKQEILTAARRCFVRDGFAGASIADICAEAGISPGHLYHYFPSKEAIVGAMGAAALSTGAAQFGELMEGSHALAALASVIENAKNRNLRDDFILILEILMEAGRNPKLAKILQEQSRNVRRILAEFLRKSQADGLIDPGLDPEAASAILFGLLDGARMMTIRDPKIDMTKVLDHLKILVGRFLLPPRPAS
ncbi:MAG: TetR/AcrR family transcriptional regulator [Pseudomonadota bacterium]